MTPHLTPVLLLWLLSVTAFAVAEERNDELHALHLSQAWIREAPPGMNMTAGYFKLDNPNPQDLILKQVTSPQFARIELHQTVIEDGMAKMRPLTELVIPAQASVQLIPNGQHLMLSEPTAPFDSDSEIALTLHFANGYQQAFIAPVLSLSELDRFRQEE